MEIFIKTSWLFFLVDLLLRLGFSARIVRRKLPAGVAWAWLSLILFLPVFGTIIYAFFGEYRQGRRRQKRLAKAQAHIEKIAEQAHAAVDYSQLGRFSSLAQAYQKMFGLPPQAENDIELLPYAKTCFPRLIQDVDAAQSTIDLEFYIWSDGGDADRFGEALIRAAKRGVRVRLLVDAIGSRSFIRGPHFKRLREAGVKAVIALPSGVLRSIFARPDLRIHRKIAIIDGRIGYTGSLNLADPKFFNLKARVGPWVDLLARIQGPSVRALAAVFLSDWCAETGENFSQSATTELFTNSATAKASTLQCLPSGPATRDSEIEQALIMALTMAEEEITLTTPYFVPSDALRYALVAAARRGIATTLIIPKKVDSKLTHYASRSFLRDLTSVGVRIALYKPGLLHTKSVVIDRAFSWVGSLNLDPRSLRINFEITMAVYDHTFAKSLRALQDEYLKDSDIYSLDSVEGQRAIWLGDLARLISPLL